MIDDRIVELIHADIDGCLAPAERAELSRALLADPEAHALHRELQRLAQALGSVPAQDPPGDLSDSIMASIPPRARPSGGDAGPKQWRRFMAVAAGVLAVTVALRIVDVGHGVDGSDAVGTMAAGRTAPSASIDRPEVSGSVSLRRAGAALYVDLEMEPRADIEVLASREGVSARAVARAGAGGERRQLSIELPAAARGPVSVRILSAGRVLEEVELRAPPEQ